MPRMKEKSRRVIEQRIQGASPEELEAIGALRSAGLEGLGQAASISDIRGIIGRGPEDDIRRVREAVFGEGLEQGLRPIVDRALKQAMQVASARGIPRSTLAAGLMGEAQAGVLAPALLGAQSQFAGLLPTAFNQRFQEAGMEAGLRGQSFNELAAALSRDLQERSQNRTTTERTFERSNPLWKKILGTVGGAFLGGIGEAAAGALFKRDGGEDTTNFRSSAPSGGFSLSPTVESMRPKFTASAFE